MPVSGEKVHGTALEVGSGTREISMDEAPVLGIMPGKLY